MCFPTENRCYGQASLLSGSQAVSTAYMVYVRTQISFFPLFPMCLALQISLSKGQSASENLISSQARFFLLLVLCQVFVPPLATLEQNHLLVIKRRDSAARRGLRGAGAQRLGSPSGAALPVPARGRRPLGSQSPARRPRRRGRRQRRAAEAGQPTDRPTDRRTAAATEGRRAARARLAAGN